jgi:hypothetical protein
MGNQTNITTRKRSARRTVALLVVCAMAAAIGGAFGSLHLAPPIGSDSLRVDAADLDFGEAWGTSEFDWTLPIQNVGTSPVEIDDLIPSCRCTKIELRSRPLTVAPHQVERIPLRLDLSPRSLDEQRAEIRDFSVPIAVRVKGELPVEKWTLHGRVRQAYEVHPGIIDFGRLVRGEPTSMVQAEVVPRTPLRSVDVDCDARYAKAAIERSAKDSVHYTLSIQPTDSAPEGYVSFAVYLRGTTDRGVRLPGIPVQVEGTIENDIHALPSALLIPAHRFGAELREVVTVSSQSGRRFSARVSECPAGFEILPRTSLDAASHHFAVSAHARIAGKVEEKLSIAIYDGTNNPTTITIPVSSHVLQQSAP